MPVYRSVADLESISIDTGQIILRSTSIKLSVIFINEHMTFTQHVNRICSEVSKSIGILHKIRYDFHLIFTFFIFYN